MNNPLVPDSETANYRPGQPIWASVKTVSALPLLKHRAERRRDRQRTRD